jgi:exosortase C (VPDSG-CTERM-specific)
MSVVVICAAFAKPLVELVQFGLASETQSHILLIPLVSAYLIWVRRQEVMTPRPTGYGIPAALLAGVTVVLVTAACLTGKGVSALGKVDLMFLKTSALVLLVLSCGWFFLGTRALSAISLPLSLLFFMAPLPGMVEDGLEAFFQRTSADVASFFMSVVGVPVFRDGLTFRLPGLVVQVGRECSGVRSSVALFLTSMIAGHMFLRSGWKRLALTLFVIPLGIVRNGFRIFTICALCAWIRPEMINSAVHRKGGPFFFVLSLFPFFGLLLLFYRSERAKRSVVNCSGNVAQQGSAAVREDEMRTNRRNA